MGDPLLSVITVCYQAEKGIERTIRSVLDQTFTDYEYILKDGGSTDRTNALIGRYIPRFEKKGVRVIHVSSRDGGLYDAMNQAVSLARGKWCAFLNAGDYYFDEDTLCQVFSREYEETIVYGNTVEVEAGVAYHLEGDISRIREKSLICHQSSLIRTDWMKEAGYDTGYRIAADYDFFLKSFMEGKTFHKMERYIAVFMKDGISSTGELERVRETEAIRARWGLTDPASEEYKKKLRMAALKQAILDYTPKSFSDILRKIRRKQRGMDTKVRLESGETYRQEEWR